MKIHITAAGALAFGLMAQSAAAQDAACTFEGLKGYELDEAQVAELYSCIEADLAEGYAAGDDEVAAVYRTWGETSTAPYSPGVHGDRLLFTFANDIALEGYIGYPDDESFVMPVGSVLAKESFSVRDNGEPRPGPLFIMTKVAEGEADEFGNWVYSAVQPNGNAMGIQQSFCSDCHANYTFSDSMGLPAPDVRFGAE